MNRRNFFGEAATSFMACSGLAMFAAGSKLRRDLDVPEKEWFGAGWSLYAWRVRSKYGDHSWIEFRETIFQLDGDVFTRPWNSLGSFTKTTIGKEQYPVGQISEVRSEIGMYSVAIPASETHTGVFEFRS